MTSSAPDTKQSPKLSDRNLLRIIEYSVAIPALVLFGVWWGARGAGIGFLIGYAFGHILGLVVCSIRIVVRGRINRRRRTQDGA